MQERGDDWVTRLMKTRAIMDISPDDDGNVLVLERVSVKPYRSQDEYIYAMKEDLADWFNRLYTGLSLTENNFFSSIENGVILCQHANTVLNYIHDFSSSASDCSSLDGMDVVYKKTAKAGTFQSRDNICNFLAWCRSLHIPDTLLFETEDLVARKNERNVVLCLLEVARRGAKYGVPAPTIIQMEQEIDREIEEEKNLEKPPTPPVQRKTCDMMSLDEMVRDLVGRCTCPDQFPIIKVSDGKYKIGENETLIFVRILRNHVMVRIGGGWDTLENYLNRHDPCRCGAKGHKMSRPSTPVNKPTRRVSTPTPKTSPRPKTPKQRPSLQEAPNYRLFSHRHIEAEPEKDARAKEIVNTPSTPLLNGVERKERRAPGTAMPVTDRNPPATKRPASPLPLRAGSPAIGRPASPGPLRASPLPTQKWAERRDSRPSSPVPSARERRVSSSSNSSMTEESNRGRTNDRRAPGCAKRSGSIPRPNREEEALVVRRDSEGKHSIEHVRDGERKEVTKEPVKRLNSAARLNMTVDQLLPNMLKVRSQGSASSDQNDDTASEHSPLSKTAPEVMMPTTYQKQKRSAMTKAKTVSSIPSGRSTPTAQRKMEAKSEADLNTSRSKRPSSAQGNAERGRSPQRQRPGSARALSSSRASSVSRQLPETPKRDAHSKTINIPEAKPESKSKSNLSHMRRNSMSSATFSLNVNYEEYPDAPPENEDLNAKMELLFEEYKKVELGLLSKEKELAKEQKVEKKSETKTQKQRRSRSVTRDVLMSGSKMQAPSSSRSSSISRPSAPAFGTSTTSSDASKQRASRKTGLASMANPPNANNRKAHARSSSVGRIPISYSGQSSQDAEEQSLPKRTIPRRSQTPLGRSTSQTSDETTSAGSTRESRSRRPSSSGIPRSKTPSTSGIPRTAVPKTTTNDGFEVENGVIKMVHEDIVKAQEDKTRSRIDESSVIHMVYKGDEESPPATQVHSPSVWRKSPSAKLVAASDSSLTRSTSNGQSRAISTPGLHQVNGHEDGQRGGSQGRLSRLPMPKSYKSKLPTKMAGDAGSLKRCDSGVDITNLSPSDNSNHGDDEGPFQPVINDPLDLENDDDYY